MLRTDKNREPMTDESLTAGPVGIGTIGVLPPIAFGRLKIEGEIKAAAAVKLKEFGIELLDVRLKRVNYNPDVLGRIYQRLISERLQIAQHFAQEARRLEACVSPDRRSAISMRFNPPLIAACRKSEESRMRKLTEIYAKGVLKIHRRPGVLRLSQRHGDLSGNVC